MPAARPLTRKAGAGRSPARSAAHRPPPRVAFASAQELTAEQLLAAPVHWPRPSRLRAPLALHGKRMAAGAKALGLETVGDLLEHLPSDSRQARTIATLRPGEQATVAVEVRAIAARPVRRRRMRPLVEARVFDATGAMRATFFNQPWLVDRYPPGTRLLLHGRPDGRGGFAVAHHAPAAGAEAGVEPGVEAPGNPGVEPQDGSVAHYPASEGLTSTQILTLVRSHRQAFADVVEPIPAATRIACCLPDRPSALAAMHFATGQGDRESARRRLAFDELLLVQLEFLRRRARRGARTGGFALSEPPTLSQRWLRDSLPFSLTRDQRRTIADIDADLARSSPMQRLLMGEVGSGKTVVALHAMLRAVEHGLQAAMMAPTETLAEQHFATIQRLLGSEPIAAALLSSSTPAKRRADVLAKLSSGELPLLVGTHALIEPDVCFRALAVLIIDEQHRFGVRQRAALVERSGAHPPHTLHMTATPIPRTLALARYGDLDTSHMRELPSGRERVRTRVACGERERERAYAELRAELSEGRQAYVVCPLIEEGDLPAPDTPESTGAATRPAAVELRAARSELQRLREGELCDYRLALLHGGMRTREKQQAMEGFYAGDVDVLVATTVIEVGIDVPNATMMLIENAERFGISQLHQLRGRVGRGEHRASCILLGPAAAGRSRRLRALAEHSDGFRLAAIDLELRSEGELIGTKQSGFGSYRVARLPDDEHLLQLARRHAERIIRADPDLASAEHALLRAELVRAAVQSGEPIPA